jgi:hypothetical protein
VTTTRSPLCIGWQRSRSSTRYPLSDVGGHSRQNQRVLHKYKPAKRPRSSASALQQATRSSLSSFHEPRSETVQDSDGKENRDVVERLGIRRAPQPTNPKIDHSFGRLSQEGSSYYLLPPPPPPPPSQARMSSNVGQLPSRN